MVDMMDLYQSLLIGAFYHSNIFFVLSNLNTNGHLRFYDIKNQKAIIEFTFWDQNLTRFKMRRTDAHHYNIFVFKMMNLEGDIKFINTNMNQEIVNIKLYLLSLKNLKDQMLYDIINIIARNNNKYIICDHYDNTYKYEKDFDAVYRTLALYSKNPTIDTLAFKKNKYQDGVIKYENISPEYITAFENG